MTEWWRSDSHPFRPLCILSGWIITYCFTPVHGPVPSFAPKKGGAESGGAQVIFLSSSLFCLCSLLQFCVCLFIWRPHTATTLSPPFLSFRWRFQTTWNPAEVEHCVQFCLWSGNSAPLHGDLKRTAHCSKFELKLGFHLQSIAQFTPKKKHTYYIYMGR